MQWTKKHSLKLKGGRMTKKPTFTELEELDNRSQVHRNFQCPEYNDCLTNAAFQDLDLHCFECPLKDMKQIRLIAELESSGCFSLIENVFVPRKIYQTPCEELPSAELE
jgi:hypothetical protein